MKQNLSDVSKKVGLRIRERRKYLGLSLENLSHSLNCSVQTIAKYEKASIRVPTPILYEISKVLKTDLNYFFQDETPIPQDPTLENVRDTKELNDFPINILFVEDNFADELLIRTATENIKHTVFILREPDQMIDYLNGTLCNAPFPLPDLIILDLRMKTISGFELLSLIKKNPRTKNIPVIIYSNQCDINALRSCYKQGACSFINKSFDKEDSIKKIQQTISYWADCVILPRHEGK